MTGLIDIHAHLYEPDYDADRAGLSVEMRANGIEKIICVGCDITTSEKSIALAAADDFIYAAVGFHPCDTADITDGMWERMKKLIKSPKVVAVGEIGLDYYWEKVPRDIQRYWFEKQIDYASEVGLPIEIHMRDATLDTLEILKRKKFGHGVFHCFSGSYDALKEALNMGFYASFGGVVTFKNARRAVECVSEIPLDRLLLETDCPYLTPEPFRGKLNRPDYTMYVAEKIGQLRGMSGQEIADITNQNAKRLFAIK